MRKILIVLVLFLGTNQIVTAQNFDIYCDFPGGNIIIEKIKGDSIWIRPDLRDTKGNWFYWYFAVNNAKGMNLKFIFTLPNQFSKMGSAVSLDKGENWNWLGGESVNTNIFSYQFKNNDEVRFSVGMPYTQVDFEKFIKQYKGNNYLELLTLCKTKKDRYVEMIKIGNQDLTPKYKVLIITRNHACEMMGSYVMEGVIGAVMQNSWLLDNVEFLFIPFFDKDGVEDGDQGKNRLPRDHNRDFSEVSVHETTAALREFQPVWSENKLKLAFDIHCPWIKGNNHEYIFLVGSENPEKMERQLVFSNILESNIKGKLPFYSKNMAKPGDFDWTDPKRPKAGSNFSEWANKIKGIDMASTVEFPYSYASGRVVTAQNARDFGKDMAKAIELYLKQIL